MSDPNTSLSPALVLAATEALESANAEFARQFPGDTDSRQPVHTVYGGAHLFKADTCAKLGALALASLDEFAPTAPLLARALDWQLPAPLVATVFERVRAKLQQEPVEDFRIDFEDGYGNRPSAEEDAEAARTATEVVRGMNAGTLPPFIGIRIKPLTSEHQQRAVRTLDVFLTTLLEASAGRLPAGFVITLPKVTVAAQPETLAALLGQIESAHKLAPGTLQLELMVETTQSVLAPDGTAALPRLVRAAGGRCIGAHFGTYDYTASCGITAALQHMAHPACDFAKNVMQVTLAGTGVRLSDGATNVLPVPPQRATAGALSQEQVVENAGVVHQAWRLHQAHVRHSLETGFYQGWDLHPAQLPIRYATVYAFFQESLHAAATRLSNFVAQAARATLVGDVFDDAATGQGLLNFFLRGLACGAITLEEAATSGLTPEELGARSFAAILERRRHGHRR